MAGSEGVATRRGPSVAGNVAGGGSSASAETDSPIPRDAAPFPSTDNVPHP